MKEAIKRTESIIYQMPGMRRGRFSAYSTYLSIIKRVFSSMKMRRIIAEILLRAFN